MRTLQQNNFPPLKIGSTLTSHISREINCRALWQNIRVFPNRTKSSLPSFIIFSHFSWKKNTIIFRGTCSPKPSPSIPIYRLYFFLSSFPLLPGPPAIAYIFYVSLKKVRDALFRILLCAFGLIRKVTISTKLKQ